jgi:hypothetical protein
VTKPGRTTLTGTDCRSIPARILILSSPKCFGQSPLHGSGKMPDHAPACPGMYKINGAHRRQPQPTAPRHSSYTPTTSNAGRPRTPTDPSDLPDGDRNPLSRQREVMATATKWPSRIIVRAHLCVRAPSPLIAVWGLLQSGIWAIRFQVHAARQARQYALQGLRVAQVLCGTHTLSDDPETQAHF